jgi:hypothetical protein
MTTPKEAYAAAIVLMDDEEIILKFKTEGALQSFRVALYKIKRLEGNYSFRVLKRGNVLKLSKEPTERDGLQMAVRKVIRGRDIDSIEDNIYDDDDDDDLDLDSAIDDSADKENRLSPAERAILAESKSISGNSINRIHRIMTTYLQDEVDAAAAICKETIDMLSITDTLSEEEKEAKKLEAREISQAVNVRVFKLRQQKIAEGKNQKRKEE